MLPTEILCIASRLPAPPPPPAFVARWCGEEDRVTVQPSPRQPIMLSAMALHYYGRLSGLSRAEILAQRDQLLPEQSRTG